MKDENDTETLDAWGDSESDGCESTMTRDELLAGTMQSVMELFQSASQRMAIERTLATGGHYQAVKSPTCFGVTGNRWAGSKTPDIVRDLWQTPKWLFNYFDRLAGGFEIDAAASKENALCETFWTEQDDALSFDWPKKAKIWLNPPYSKPIPWVEHVVSQVQMHRCHVYMILPDDVSTAWFRHAIDHAAEAYMLVHNGERGSAERSGRVRFINALTGKEGGSNNKGSWVFVFRPHTAPIKISALDRTLCENDGQSIF